NRTEYFSIEGGHQKLEIVAESTVEVTANTTHKDNNSPTWESCVLKRVDSAATERPRAEIDPILSLLSFPSPRVPIVRELKEYAAQSFTPRRPIVGAISDLTSRIHADFKFDSRATSVDTPIADVLRHRRGVCQDFAHLATGCLRALGLAARY